MSLNLGPSLSLGLRLSLLKFKLNVNQNEYVNGNESGATCEWGAKRPLVGVFPRFVSVYVFVLIYV